ncbi:DUF4395 domain-containing protein [Thermophagus sp. OGC60D27]|uniref:DUF4395 domain-containing protein n=1 Tax=Thermophagus sp. OGC60D27 TaxID=3458415 RepID=UPI004037D702
MKTYAFCPISPHKINENVARINGAFTFLILLAFVYSGWFWLIAFLALDFLLRSTRLSPYSPIGIISRQMVKQLSLPPRMINAGPKIFAARIGLLVSVAILATTILQYPATAIILTSILGLFSFLEAAFGICVACKIYPFVYNSLYKPQG